MLIFITIILIASIMQTSTGFGFSIIATPFLLLLFEPRDAIQINLIVSLVISCALIAKIKNDIDIEILKRFIYGSIGGIPVGIIVLLLVDMSMLKFAVSIIILTLTALLIFNFRMRQTKRREVIVGGLSGTLTSSIGMPGPPILLYFSGIDTNKERLRATTLAFYLVIYSLSLVAQMIIVGTNKTIWISSGFALPIVIIGLFLGQLLFKRINQRSFRLFTYGILLFTGVYLFIESVG